MTDRTQLYRYKGNRCASCGLTVEEMITRYGTVKRMFEFHHVNPDTKDRHYKRLMAQRLSRRKMEEIDKCVLLCTQCHGIIHAQEITGTLQLSAELQHRIVRQHFQGWIRADKVAKSFTFVTNQPYMLELCEVRVGSRAPIFMFLVEVEQKRNLQRWLEEIEQHKTIEICSLRNRRYFMRIEHVHGSQISVTHALGLPITTLEFYPIDRPNELIFFRNGFLLTATGEIHSEGQLTYNCTLTLPATQPH
jgi:hypothetical protein